MIELDQFLKLHDMTLFNISVNYIQPLFKNKRSVTPTAFTDSQTADVYYSMHNMFSSM